MNINTRRILILFSVALNIGFVITAAILWYYHPQPSKERHWQEIKDALYSLNLPEDQERATLEELTRFRSTMKNKITAIKDARREFMALLAQPGEIDGEEFERFVLKANKLSLELDNSVVEHFVNLRRKLGQEQGAAFFSALLETQKSEKDHR